jgi:hypothetical protein
MQTVRSRSLLGIVASSALMAAMLFGAGTASAAGADTCTAPVGAASVLECAQVPVQPAAGGTATGSASEVGSASQVAPTKTVVTRAPAVQQPLVAPAPASAASDAVGTASGTYTNVDGNQVERPDANAVGATALCNDGKYSHSLNRSGTCSSNGGVAQFLTGNGTTTTSSPAAGGDQFNGRYWDDGKGHHRYGWGWNRERHCWQYAAPQDDTPVKVSQVSSVPTGGVDTGDGSFGP